MKNLQLKQEPLQAESMVLTVVVPENWQQKTLVAELFDASGHIMQRSAFVSSGQSATFSLYVEKGTYFFRLTNSKDGLCQVKQVMVA